MRYTGPTQRAEYINNHQSWIAMHYKTLRLQHQDTNFLPAQLKNIEYYYIEYIFWIYIGEYIYIFRNAIALLNTWYCVYIYTWIYIFWYIYILNMYIIPTENTNWIYIELSTVADPDVLNLCMIFFPEKKMQTFLIFYQGWQKPGFFVKKTNPVGFLIKPGFYRVLLGFLGSFGLFAK